MNLHFGYSQLLTSKSRVRQINNKNAEPRVEFARIEAWDDRRKLSSAAIRNKQRVKGLLTLGWRPGENSPSVKECAVV
jgi:hypothetical protein